MDSLKNGLCDLLSELNNDKSHLQMTKVQALRAISAEYKYTTSDSIAALGPFRDLQTMILHELKVVLPSLTSKNLEHARELLSSLERAKIYNLALAIMWFIKHLKTTEAEDSDYALLYQSAWSRNPEKFISCTYGELFPIRDDNEEGGCLFPGDDIINEQIKSVIADFDSTNAEDGVRDNSSGAVPGIQELTGVLVSDCVTVYSMCLFIIVAFLNLLSKRGSGMLRSKADREPGHSMFGCQVNNIMETKAIDYSGKDAQYLEIMKLWWPGSKTKKQKKKTSKEPMGGFPHHLCDVDEVHANERKRRCDRMIEWKEALENLDEELKETRKAVAKYTKIRVDEAQRAYDEYFDPTLQARNEAAMKKLSKTNLLTNAMDVFKEDSLGMSRPLFTYIKKRTEGASDFLSQFSDRDLCALYSSDKDACNRFYTKFRPMDLGFQYVRFTDAHCMLDPAQIDPVDTSILAPPFVNRLLRSYLSDDYDENLSHTGKMAREEELVNQEICAFFEWSLSETCQQEPTHNAEHAPLPWLKTDPESKKGDCYCGVSFDGFDMLSFVSSKAPGYHQVGKHANQCHLWWFHALKRITAPVEMGGSKKVARIDQTAGMKKVARKDKHTFAKIIPYHFFRVINQNLMIKRHDVSSIEMSVLTLERILTEFRRISTLGVKNNYTGKKPKAEFSIDDGRMELTVGAKWAAHGGDGDATLGQKAHSFVLDLAARLVNAMIAKLKDKAFQESLVDVTEASFFNAFLYILTNSSIWESAGPPVHIFFSDQDISELKAGYSFA
jgi:hypothetical protein